MEGAKRESKKGEKVGKKGGNNSRSGKSARQGMFACISPTSRDPRDATKLANVTHQKLPDHLSGIVGKMT